MPAVVRCWYRKKGWRKRKKKKEKKNNSPRKREKKRTLQESRTHTHTQTRARTHAHQETPEPGLLNRKRCGVGPEEMRTEAGAVWPGQPSWFHRKRKKKKTERKNCELDLIRQCGCVLLGLSLQQSVHRMHPPLAFDAVQIHPPLLRVMN